MYDMQTYFIGVQVVLFFIALFWDIVKQECKDDKQ